MRRYRAGSAIVIGFAVCVLVGAAVGREIDRALNTLR